MSDDNIIKVSKIRREGSGAMKLTAEQVRKAIFNGSAYASYDGAKYYADGINMQAIADELNTRADDYKQAAEYWQRMYEQTIAERRKETTKWHLTRNA